jgi:hypothetical protein
MPALSACWSNASQTRPRGDRVRTRVALAFGGHALATNPAPWFIFFSLGKQMSRNNIADELDAAMRNRRKSGAFWEWPDKKVKEWDVVSELLRSMHARGDCRYTQVESIDGEWPDCVIRDSAGVQVGVEVTEFVDQKAVEMCEKGMNVYRQWSDQEVLEKVEQILATKDGKAHHGGLYGKVILVIHTDEVADLQSFRLFPIFDASAFPRPRNIDEAYLICSYEPGLGYPYIRLNLGGPSTG